MKYFTLFALIILSINNSSGQVFDSDVPATTCLGQKIFLKNNLLQNASSVEWDFCQGDLHQLNPLVTSVAANIQVPIGLTLFKTSSNKWYGFICDRANSKISRLDFGTDPTNKSPQVTDLGNPSGNLQGPQNIKIVEFQNNFYGFVNNLQGNALVRIPFGGNIENPVATSDILSANSGSANGGMDIAFDGTNWVIALTNSNNLTLFNLGSSPGNNVSNTLNTSAISGIIDIGDINFVYEDNGWHAFVCGYSSATFHRLDFGNNLFSNPTSVQLSVSTSYLPYGLRVAQDNNEWLVFATTSIGNLIRLNFGNDITNTNPDYKDLGRFGAFTNTLKIALVKGKSRWVGLTSRYDVNGFFLVEFPEVASSFNKSYSYNLDSVTISTIAFGTRYYSLTAQDPTGQVISKTAQTSISGLTSPSISLSNTVCGNPIQFNFSSPYSISEILWDFNNDWISDANSNSPSKNFSAGDHQLHIQIKDSEGCSNYLDYTISVYNPPSPAFLLPTASPFCTNQNYTYTNTSTFDNGSNPTWQWSVNGINVATTKDLSYAFNSPSAQSVMLTASIPGCSTQSTQNINTLVDGPLVTFNSPPTGCKGSVISFTNTTTGNILSQSWSFGDGNTSTQSNTVNTYSTAGPFTVSLSTTNSNGCQNSATKNISIYSVPQPDFAIEAPPLSCERSPAQLDNLTPALVDSNISSWSWSFGDANNGSSTLKNPTYTYASAGSYNVSLRATSNFGCTKSIQKSVSISPSPIANFTNSAACVNQGTRFTDASSGSVSFYQWTIQNNILSGSTPSYTFRSSGSFPVTLTITSANGCTGQITKNIVVPVLPFVDFTVQAPCTGHPSVFRELNPDTADPAVAWNWNFGQASGTGSPVSYQFASEGGHTVTMSTTRQSGCVYSTSENISISAGPIASFTPSIFAGAAPLNVVFNNTSVADTYLWSFGDQAQTTSTIASPAFTYNTLGKYKALLTAKNNLGCSDTLSTEIYVVIPHVDVAMNGLSLTNDLTSNTSKPVVTILNSGNMPLIDPIIIFDLGGGASIKEKVSGIVRPGKSLSQTLGLQIIPSSIKYFCAEIEAANDVNLYNNRQCVSLSHENIVMAPYPNPATSGQVTLEWIGASRENATVTIFRSNGEIVFEQHVDQLQAGLGQLDINTSSMSNGLYLIRFVGSTVTKTFRIVIAN